MSFPEMVQKFRGLASAPLQDPHINLEGYKLTVSVGLKSAEDLLSETLNSDFSLNVTIIDACIKKLCNIPNQILRKQKICA